MFSVARSTSKPSICPIGEFRRVSWLICRLHAKVYVADRSCALVTSANLMPSGMDFNFEFGVEFHDSEFVGNVMPDLESYSRLGNVLSRQSLADLQSVADELRAEFQKVQKSAASSLKRRFSEKLRAANYQFLRAQVGTRSAHSLFSEAILYALAATPLRAAGFEVHDRALDGILEGLLRETFEKGRWRGNAALPSLGKFQAGGFHHRLRDGESYAQKWQYVRKNSVRAGLVTSADDWPYFGCVHEIRWSGD